MATGDHPAQAETAAKLQALADKVGKHQADAKASSESDQTKREKMKPIKGKPQFNFLSMTG